MISTVLCTVSALTFVWQAYDFTSDQYAIYFAIKKLRNKLRKLNVHRLITTTDDGWENIEDWEYIE